MVWSVILVVALVLSPSVALAEEGTQTPTQTPTVVDSGQQLQDLNEHLQSIETKLDALKPTEPSEDAATLNDVVQKLDGLSEGVNGLSESLNQEYVPEESVALPLAASMTTFNVYSNVNPTGQYAQYASRLLPKVGFTDDYCYFNDSRDSYVLVWGDIVDGGGGTFIGNDCRWARWYYSGSAYNYVFETGGGDCNINLNGYVVLSNVGDYPVLDDGTWSIHNLCVFVLVAFVAGYLIHELGRFVLRMRGGTLG